MILESVKPDTLKLLSILSFKSLFVSYRVFNSSATWKSLGSLMPSAGTYGNEEACNTNANEFVYWTLIDKTQLTHDVHHYVLKQTTPVINIYIYIYNTFLLDLKSRMLNKKS